MSDQRGLVLAVFVATAVHAMAWGIGVPLPPAVDLPRDVQRLSLQLVAAVPQVPSEALPQPRTDPIAVVDPATATVEAHRPAPEMADRSQREAPLSTSSPILGAQIETQPLPKHNQPPRYPRLARRRGWEGTVTLEVGVEATGNVTTAHILSSSGHASLDAAAVEAVLGWRFRPAQRGGRRVAATIEVPVEFRIDETSLNY